MEKSISSYCVQKLANNNAYLFRVIAENPIGESEPIESDPVTIKVKYGKSNYTYIWQIEDKPSYQIEISPRRSIGPTSTNIRLWNDR